MVAVLTGKDAAAMSAIIIKVALIDITVRIGDRSHTIAQAFDQIAGKFITIGLGQSALAVDFTLFPSAHIGYTVGHG